MRRAKIYLAVLFITLLSSVLVASAATNQKSTREELTRFSSKGGITVEAALRNPLDNLTNDILTWDISLTTHSGDLSRLDMASLVKVRNDKNEEVTTGFSFKWTTPSSHHPIGRLTLDLTPAMKAKLLDSKPNYIDLVITGLGGRDEQILRWEAKWFAKS